MNEVSGVGGDALGKQEPHTKGVGNSPEEPTERHPRSASQER